MTGPATEWRIGVRGVVRPRTASLLAGMEVVVADTVTVLEAHLPPGAGCAELVGTLQGLGLEVIEVHRISEAPE